MGINLETCRRHSRYSRAAHDCRRPWRCDRNFDLRQKLVSKRDDMVVFQVCSVPGIRCWNSPSGWRCSVSSNQHPSTCRSRSRNLQRAHCLSRDWSGQASMAPSLRPLAVCEEWSYGLLIEWWGHGRLLLRPRQLGVNFSQACDAFWNAD